MWYMGVICGVIGVVDSLMESRWLYGNALASDTNGPGSIPGSTLELDTGYHRFVGLWQCSN